jgi:hypothetical protein
MRIYKEGKPVVNALGWALWGFMCLWTAPISLGSLINRGKYVGTVQVGIWRFKVYRWRVWFRRYDTFWWPNHLHDGDGFGRSYPGRLPDHEGEGHGVQQMIFGPLFLPLYLLGLVVGYRNNPFEIWARHMETHGQTAVWVDGPHE